MFYKILTLACVAFTLLISCKKDISTNTLHTAGSIVASDPGSALSTDAGTLDTSSHWYGTYLGHVTDYPIMPDDSIIKNGFAQLTHLDQNFAFTKINYDIPAQYNLIGDSVVFIANVKNTKAIGFRDFDVALQVIGEQHSADVRFVADEARSGYTQLVVGGFGAYGTSALVHYFTNFENIKLSFKNYVAKVYLGDSLLYSLRYNQINTLGRIKTITIAFKGYGKCNAVFLNNSYTHKAILSESFDYDGQTHTIYY